MKKSIIQLIRFLIITVFLLSCNKGKDYTIKGRIVEDCAGNTPVANTEFTFISNDFGSLLRKDGLQKTIKTDANGYFEFAYNSKKLSKNGIYIKGLFEIDRFSIYDAPIKSHENFDLGDFPLENIYPFKINLIVNNSYTVNDTLFVENKMKDTIAIIPGPFSNSIFGPFNSALNVEKFEYKDGILYQQTWVKIRSNIISNPATNSTKKLYSIQSSVKMCDSAEKTFDLTID